MFDVISALNFPLQLESRRVDSEALRKDGYLENETMKLLSRTHLQTPAAASEVHKYGQFRRSLGGEITQMHPNFSPLLVSSPNLQVGNL